MSVNTKKNKRGGRGSSDEDLACLKKKLNTADDIDDAIEMLEDTQQEPSLLEIKTILIDIQIQLSSITKDNLELKNEIEQLKNLVRNQGNDLDELRKSVNFNDNDINQLKQSIKKIGDEKKQLQDKVLTANNSLNATREKLQQQVEESRHLEEELDNLEQYSRKNSLEIHGVPQDAYTSTEHVVIKVAEALNITVEPEDIEILHKIYRGKAIIAKFVNHKVKCKLYKERTKLKSVKLSDILPSYPATSSRNHRIYLNENLTIRRKHILEEANRRKRDGTLFSVWTLDGKIFVKTSPTGNTSKILSVDDLDNL